MIVNPAYAYMRKKEKVLDFPFWENGQLNVSMAGSTGADFIRRSNRAYANNGGTALFTVNASNYTKIKFNMNSSGPTSVRVYASEAGNEYGTETYSSTITAKDFEFTIPKAFRKNNAKFGFSPISQVTYFNSIVLTN